MARRYFNNVCGTGSLTAPVGTSDTSLSTTGYTSSPSVPHTAVIDRGLAAEEVVLVTAVSGGTLTVTRGYDTTASSSHSAGALIEHAIIAEGPNKWDDHAELTTGFHGISGTVVTTTATQTVTNKTNQTSVFEGTNSTSPGTGPLHKATVDSTSRAGFSADTTGTGAAGKAFQVTQSGSDKFLVNADGSVAINPSGPPTWAEDITGNQRVTGGQTVTGTSTLGTVNTSGNVTSSGNVSAVNVTASGTAQQATNTTTGNATIGGTLGVTGATTAAGVTASGTVTGNRLVSTTDLVAPNNRHTGILVGGVTLVSTTSTSYVTLGSSDVSFTMPYPTSGVATVALSCVIYNSLVGAGVCGVMSFEIRDTNSSGTQRVAASDDRGVLMISKVSNEGLGTASMTHVVTGLPTSGTMYIRAMYKSTDAGNTAQFGLRRMTVIPSP